MKILIMHHQMSLFGGAELVVVRLATYLQNHGHKVTILAGSVSPHEEYKDLEIITPIPQTPWRIWNTKTLPDIYKVYHGLGQVSSKIAKNYDVVNVHNFPAIWSAPRHTKIVWMCNEIADLWHSDGTTRFIDKAFNVARKIDRYVVNSKTYLAAVADSYTAKMFYTRYGRKPEIIPYGIDSDFFSSGDKVLQRSLWKKFIVIHPAMISPSKNQLGILEAVNKLRFDIPNIRVLFVGRCEPNGDYMIKLQNYIRTNDLQTYIRFTNNVDRLMLRRLYNASHVAVFPGKGQGSWLGPFEAIAADVPIIVSPNLSCSGLIAEKNLGTVSNDLIGSLRKIERECDKEQINKAREFVKTELTWDKYCMKMEELMTK